MSNLVPFADMQSMAHSIAASGLFGMKTADQALALMLVAQAEGQHPATITQDYDIIQGKAARKTHSVLARFQQMGGTVEWHELTDKIADATFSHKAGGTLRLDWTFAQAEKSKLTGKDNWKNYPRAMLRARCIAEGIRAIYPAAIGGMMVSEEAQDAHPVEARQHQAPVAAISQQAGAEYPAADFAANLEKWREMIASGKKTADQIIAFVESKGAPLSTEQKAEIRGESEAIEGEFIAEGDNA